MEQLRFIRPEEIEALGRRPGVKRVAVDNFLSSLDPCCDSLRGTLLRLDQDTKVYRWSPETRRAIYIGVCRCYGKEW